MPVPVHTSVRVEGTNVIVEADSKDTSGGALHGTMRANLKNAVVGISTGWSRTLELSGVGYRAALSGANLVLNVGFSHPVTIVPPPGVTFAVTEGKIVVTGADKHVVGQTAANVRAVKKPEPYKGKGIKYEGEHIRKKAGKSAKAIGGAPGAK
jgi:large subunit ribosomal protein L6